jgi:hypothetical protein
MTVNRAMMDKSDWNRVRQFGLPCQSRSAGRVEDAWRPALRDGDFQKNFEPVKAQEFRLNILAAAKGPAISEIKHQ